MGRVERRGARDNDVDVARPVAVGARGLSGQSSAVQLIPPRPGAVSGEERARAAVHLHGRGVVLALAHDEGVQGARFYDDETECVAAISSFIKKSDEDSCFARTRQKKTSKSK